MAMNEIAHNQPLISVIVVSYNSMKFLGKCLQSVWETTYGKFEIILVDNASTDGSIEYVEKKFGHENRLHIIRNARNLGFAEGNNVGAQAAKGDFIAFLNSDTTVNPDWLNESLKVLRSDLTIGVCQSKLLSMENPKVIDSTGDFIDYYGVMMRRGGDLKEKDVGQYDKAEEIFSARAAAMIVKRKVIEEVGLFDPIFFITYDDIDFCWRVRLRGYKVVFAPKSIVYHVGEAFTPTVFKVFFTTRNWLISLMKNYELKTLGKILPSVATLVMSIIAAELFVRKRPDLALRRIKGILWVVQYFKIIYKKRLKVQFQIRKLPDSEIMKHMVKTNLAISHWLPLWRRQFQIPRKKSLIND